MYDNTGSLDPTDRTEPEERWVLPSSVWLYIYLPCVSVARSTIRSYQFQLMFMCIVIVMTSGQFQSSSVGIAQFRETM